MRIALAINAYKTRHSNATAALSRYAVATMINEESKRFLMPAEAIVVGCLGFFLNLSYTSNRYSDKFLAKCNGKGSTVAWLY